MKTALVLSGGEFKGAFQSGVYSAMKAAGITPDLIVGISIGTVNGAFFAQGKDAEASALYEKLGVVGPGMIYTSEFLHVNGAKITVDENAILKRLGLKFDFKTIVSAVFGGLKSFIRKIIGRAGDIRSVADNSPLLAILAEHTRRSDFKIPFRLGLVSETTGKEYFVGPEDFDDDFELAKAILASATMPGMWAPVESIRLKNSVILRECVDGGVRTNAPLRAAMDYIESLGEDVEDWRVLCLNCNTVGMEEQAGKQNLAGIGARTLNIMMDEILDNDLSGVERINNILDQIPKDFPVFSPSGRRYRRVKLDIIELPPELAGFLDSSPETIRRRVLAGQALGKRYCEAQKELTA